MSLQVKALVNIIEEENQMRTEYSSGADIVYTLEDLQLGANGNLKVLQPGRRFKLVLGEQGESLYTYKSVLLDAKQQLAQFSYHCGVFIVPKVSVGSGAAQDYWEPKANIQNKAFLVLGLPY